MSGFLTTHVLDTSKGRPAEGLVIELFRVGKSERQFLRGMTTNADGRTEHPILPAEEFRTGTYELVFHVGRYLLRNGFPSKGELFLDEVPIRFGMSENDHYHVPLLVSPFGYSTYRGS